MNPPFSEKTIVVFFLALFTMVMGCIAILANGTGDDGDAVFHFLFSKYAFAHPENFLNHWAKPVFVLITAPVAQLGFVAMKIFNAAMLTATIWLTWLTARKLQIPNAWFVIFPLMAAPMNISHTLSGLTEPMFAFWLIAGVYWFVSKKPVWAVLWLSFLPFVRSEGLIIFCVVLLYLLSIRQWKLIPLLAVGHLVYGLVGFPYHGDFFWIFNKMTYIHNNYYYGSGTWYHFLQNMPAVIAEFLCFLLAIGLLEGAVRLVKFIFGKDKPVFSNAELWLVYGIFVAYLVAHSLFWYLGIFSSYGLMRVMIGVLPMASILCLNATNWAVSGILKNNAFAQKGGLHWIAMAVMMIFLFKNISWEKDLMLNATQQTQYDAAKKYGDKYRDGIYYFDAVYGAMAFDVDWFDGNRHRRTPQLFNGDPIPKNSLVLWDDWFSYPETRMPLDTFVNDSRFKLLEKFEEMDNRFGKTRTSVLFEVSSADNAENVVYNNDFENESFPPNADTSTVYHGQKSVEVVQKQPYSPGYNGYMNALGSFSKIRCSFWALAPPNPENLVPGAKAVFSFETNEKSFDWHGETIFHQPYEIGKWKFLVFERSIPKPKTADDRAKVYIWNETPTPVFIDNLKIELLE